MPKPAEPEEAKKRLMGHYWEGKMTNGGANPERLTVELLRARILELDTIIGEREAAGLAYDWLVEERTWRRRQIQERGGEV